MQSANKDLQSTIKITRKYWRTSTLRETVAQPFHRDLHRLTCKTQEHSGSASTTRDKISLENFSYSVREIREGFERDSAAKRRRPKPVRKRTYFSPQRNDPEKTQCFVQIITFKLHPCTVAMRPLPLLLLCFYSRSTLYLCSISIFFYLRLHLYIPLPLPPPLCYLLLTSTSTSTSILFYFHLHLCLCPCLYLQVDLLISGDIFIFQEHASWSSRSLGHLLSFRNMPAGFHDLLSYLCASGTCQLDLMISWTTSIHQEGANWT